MAKGSRLKSALDRTRGVDHKQDHQKRLQKQAEKRKRQKEQQQPLGVDVLEDGIGGAQEDVLAQALTKKLVEKRKEEEAAHGAELAEKVDGEVDGWETDKSEEADEGGEAGGIELGTFEDESESDSEDDATFYTAAGGSPVKKLPNGNSEEVDEDEDEEDDIPLSDIESLASEDRGDVIPHQRLTINNTAALQRSLKSFALSSSLPFSTTQSVTSSAPVEIADVEDDLGRELAFYKQSLDAVKEARIQLKKEGVAFTRPTDYFAEMVKSEEQMGKVRQKMVDEAARKKASSDARRQRDLKKFGKAVQVAKMQERDKAKRETLDKINVLKRSELLPKKVQQRTVTDIHRRTTRCRPQRQRRRHVRRRARERCGHRESRPCGETSQRCKCRWTCEQKAAKERRKVRVWGQEEIREEQRRQIGGRCERILREAHEGQGWEAAAGEEQACEDVNGWRVFNLSDCAFKRNCTMKCFCRCRCKRYAKQAHIHARSTVACSVSCLHRSHHQRLSTTRSLQTPPLRADAQESERITITDEQFHRTLSPLAILYI